MLTQAMLGFLPDAPRNKLYVDPLLPDWLPDFTIRLRWHRVPTTVTGAAREPVGHQIRSMGDPLRHLFRALLCLPLLLGGSLLVAPSASAAPAVKIYFVYFDSPGSDTGSNSSLNAEYVTIKNTSSTSISSIRILVSFSPFRSNRPITSPTNPRSTPSGF